MHSEIRFTTGKPLIFTLSEANASLRLIRRWTTQSQKEIKLLLARKTAGEEAPEKTEKNKLIDTQIREVLARWQKRVRQLGAIPRGLWTVDFDHGQGLFCWRYPETEIKFEHDYDHGGSGRRPIKESSNQNISLCELP
jgi:hypothetical protein